MQRFFLHVNLFLLPNQQHHSSEGERHLIIFVSRILCKPNSDMFGYCVSDVCCYCREALECFHHQMNCA